jgi:subtilisin family serine protease
MLKRVAFVLAAVAVLAFGLFPSGALAESPPQMSSLLVKLVSGLTPDEQAAVIARNGGTETGTIPALRLHVVELLTVELADTLARYQADPQVQHVEENRIRRSELLSNDALAVEQWALPQIGWDLVFGSVVPAGSAKAAILDTGIDASHPDLFGRVVAGISILDGGDGLTDSHGHGTQMAGIVAANTDNGAGVAGVAFTGVQVMPVTVLDANGEGRDSDVIAGVLWAADHGADVILMPFSNSGFSQNLQDAIDYAWSRGALLVAATGNDGVSTPTFPAGDRGVIGVSGTDPADALLAFSNYGQAAFLAAPGESIVTTGLGGEYVAVSGTSASAAIVAGVAAFLKAVDPSLTNGMIVARMARTADPAGTQEQTGNGRVNMARAIEDTGTDEIQPAGAAPVGAGGPYVGPYRAASVDIVNITSPLSPVTITSLPGIVTVSFDYSSSASGTTTGLAEVLGTAASNSKTLDSGAAEVLSRSV